MKPNELQQVENSAYRITAQVIDDCVHITLEDLLLDSKVADGPCTCIAIRECVKSQETLQSPAISTIADTLIVKGKLAGLDVEHTFHLPTSRPIMEEYINVYNNTKIGIALSDFRICLQRKLTDDAGVELPELIDDRWVALPMRCRADVANPLDYSLIDMLTKPGREYLPAESWTTPKALTSSHHVSEGWAWKHGDNTLGIFCFNQENMLFSVLSVENIPDGKVLCFGGAAMISKEPAALTRIEPGQRIDLGMIRYQSVKGEFKQTNYAFRSMLDEKGCRFPSNYDPPVHWEQLYDMEGAWNGRINAYTQDALDKEAAKGCEYSCDALYLDPGWDTTFGSFLWGEEWLGPRKQWIQGIKEKYGLKVALHCPMPPWSSHAGLEMGPCDLLDWPHECRRVPPSESSFLNIDLGAEYVFSKICLKCDQSTGFGEKLRVLAAKMSDAGTTDWNLLVPDDEKSYPCAVYEFDEVSTRWLRIESADQSSMLSFESIEIYINSGAFPFRTITCKELLETRSGPLLCMGSKQFLAEAEKRLLEHCADGVAFLMFDGTWWNGECTDPQHGHPIPYRMEDHIRNCIDLAKRIHDRYPNVIIEMHDMLNGGAPQRATPVYYKYGLPGSYDENWGFELMWDPMADLQSGRSRALYYYNLGCNVPVYLHIDLRKDNENCVVLWYYASTCRHLGIGGTHIDTTVMQSQKDAMRLYQKLARFYKRGDFYGITEEIHIHALPEENACVINLFNLTDQTRTVSGQISLNEIGINQPATCSTASQWVNIADGILNVSLEMPAWSAKVASVNLIA